MFVPLDAARLPAVVTCGPAPEPWILPSSTLALGSAPCPRARSRACRPARRAFTAPLATASVVMSICSTAAAGAADDRVGEPVGEVRVAALGVELRDRVDGARAVGAVALGDQRAALAAHLDVPARVGLDHLEAIEHVLIVEPHAHVAGRAQGSSARRRCARGDGRAIDGALGPAARGREHEVRTPRCANTLRPSIAIVPAWMRAPERPRAATSSADVTAHGAADAVVLGGIGRRRRRVEFGIVAGAAERDDLAAEQSRCRRPRRRRRCPRTR